MGESAVNSMVGWDLGGAHVKAAWVHDGMVRSVWQLPCPLWQGLDQLTRAVGTILSRLPVGCRHGVTMTGEMVDLFSSRGEGIQAILTAFVDKAQDKQPYVFVPPDIIPLSCLSSKNIEKLASNNWLISVHWLATHCPHALLVDIGSTTTDLAPIAAGHPVCRGTDDRSRMRYGELLYMGVIRTPLMVLAEQLPFEGEWFPLMAEHFATTADVHRLLGSLPSGADQSETADGGPKTARASGVRLARIIGADKDDAPDEAWFCLAASLREIQLQRLTLACMRQLSRLVTQQVTLVGAGVGRFLLPEVARRLDLPYCDFGDFIPPGPGCGDFQPADCAPAVALALLLDSHFRQ